MTTAVQDRPVSSRDQRPARAKTRAGRVYLYLVPAAVMLVAIFAVPLADSVVLSLQNSVGIAGTAGWAGFSNFAAELSSSVFWQITWQTIIWTVGVVSLTTVISIVLASLLRQAFRGRTIFTALFNDSLGQFDSGKRRRLVVRFRAERPCGPGPSLYWA